MRLGPSLVIALTLAATLAVVSPAHAFYEAALPQDYPVNGCLGCHGAAIPAYSSANCEGCHTFNPDGPDAGTDGDFPFKGQYSQAGPHGVYSNTSDRCAMCHTLHDAPSGFKLLPGETVKATCFTCHDGTAGFGVYGTIVARIPAAQPGGHSIDTTGIVPGGDAGSGGPATVVFRGVSGRLTCSDCHSPHDSNTVQPFTGERIRVRSADLRPVYSSKLLKKRPTGADSSTDVYGSDWCLGCHEGRGAMGMAVNHPVESKVTRPVGYYYYSSLPVNFADGTGNDYQLGIPLAANAVRLSTVGNLAVPWIERHPIDFSAADQSDLFGSPWLMTEPRNAALQEGHAPICQQCHEDTRDCGELSADGTVAWIIREGLDTIDADGRDVAGPWVPDWVANPRFQNFPHETENANMLVETGDDLCLNCHPPAALP